MNVTKMGAVSPDPLILTVEMDQLSQDRFNALRSRYFPPERNWLNAHLTLFHHLPSPEPLIPDLLGQLSRETPAFNIRACGLMSLGGGVAFRMEDERLTALHKTLQQRWSPWLNAQDKQKRTFHVTIQNKVSPAAAKKLLEQLQPEFKPFIVKGTGLTLWTYRNGPWEWKDSFPLAE